MASLGWAGEPLPLRCYGGVPSFCKSLGSHIHVHNWPGPRGWEAPGIMSECCNCLFSSSLFYSCNIYITNFTILTVQLSKTKHSHPAGQPHHHLQDIAHPPQTEALPTPSDNSSPFPAPPAPGIHSVSVNLTTLGLPLQWSHTVLVLL